MLVTDAVQENARRAPSAPALRFGDATTTYAELDDWAERFAEVVRDAGGGPGRLVGVLASRGPATVACILGILRAGATCVPIHARYPEARIRFVLSDIASEVVCVFCDDPDLAAAIEGTVVPMEGPPRRLPTGRRAWPAIDPDAIAYVLYTSGSTGAPKGVMITHRSLAAVVRELIVTYQIRPVDRVVHCAPLGFDTSISEIIRALVAGACLVIAPSHVTDSPEFFYRLRFLAEHGITRAVLPAALLHSAKAVALPALQVLVTTGEACSKELVDRWAPGRILLNAWGSTESTFSGTIMQLVPGHDGRPPVGKPIPIAEIFVVGDGGELLPPGETGEIHIGGLGVSAGYYRRPELTSERFVPNVWGSRSPTAFATRDLGRWRPDGYLDCLGRMDHQVKVSGYRVDLTEVEAALQACAAIGIAQAAVVPVESVLGGTELVAHVVLHAPFAGDIATHVKQILRGLVPTYAVPRRIQVWDALPLNAHGKVDRLRLQATVPG